MGDLHTMTTRTVEVSKTDPDEFGYVEVTIRATLPQREADAMERLGRDIQDRMGIAEDSSG